VGPIIFEASKQPQATARLSTDLSLLVTKWSQVRLLPFLGEGILVRIYPYRCRLLRAAVAETTAPLASRTAPGPCTDRER